MADGPQTETRANRQTELDVDHMQQWPANVQARLLAHYEMLENWQCLCASPSAWRQERPL